MGVSRWWYPSVFVMLWIDDEIRISTNICIKCCAIPVLYLPTVTFGHDAYLDGRLLTFDTDVEFNYCT